MTAETWIFVLVALGLGFLIGQMLRRPTGGGGLASPLDSARTATIHVMPDGSGRCKSNTTPTKIHAKRLDFIHWTIKDPQHCMPDGATVQLRFPNGSPLFKDRPDHPKSIVDIVLPGATVGTHKYDVWLVEAGGNSYKMEDPEIAVEM